MGRERAPIVLFAYKRPEHALRTLESLAANPPAAESELTVYCDGPKCHAEVVAVTQLRKVVRRRSWAKTVNIIERPEHLGLARSILEGVGEVFRAHESAIVLEDDLVLSPHFLEFMNEALERYRDQPRVMQVSGYMFPISVPGDRQACFLPMISSWGWGTWRRAWRTHDPELGGFDGLRADAAAQRRFDLDGAYPYFNLLRQKRAGQLDSWAVGWYLSVFQRHGLTLFPKCSYVRNIGWDGSGTHCDRNQGFDTQLAEQCITRWPTEIVVDREAYAELTRYLRRVGPKPVLRGGLWRRIRRLLHLEVNDLSPSF